MALPKQYAWLEREPGPLMLKEALKLVGVREIVGHTHNPVILNWAKELGIESIYKADETPWCGLAHAVLLKRSAKPHPLKSWEILRALSYARFGVAVLEPMLGDTVIFQREGGGHVGLYVGEDAHYYHVLGGNQSNMYGFTRIDKDRLYAVRRPAYKVQPANVRKVFLNASGPVSTNEA